jgi:carbon monoxide dehydrogenase subunit G
MKIQFKVKKPLPDVAAYLSQPALFTEIHPAIYKIEPLGDNRYRFFERLNLGFIPFAFSYTGTIDKKSANQIEMHATVFGFVNIHIQFDLTTIEGGTLVTETVVFKSFLPIGFVMERVFKKVHQELFRNLENH